MAEPAETSSSIDTVRERGRYFLIALTGEWDLYNRPELEAALLAAETAAERCIVLDLSRATFIDSSVLGALVEARKRIEQRVPIAVVVEQNQIRKVFEITGLDRVFELRDTVDEAARVAPRPT